MDPFNSVFQGREGTGAAFLLSGNKAADVFRQNLLLDDQKARLSALQQQKLQQQQNSAVDKSLAGVKLEDHWIAHDKELQNKYRSLMDYGTKLKLDGKNPVTDPEFKTLHQRLNNEAKFSGELLTGFSAVQKQVQDNPEKYSDESIKKVMEYYDPKKPISSFMKDGFTPPQLEPKYTLSGLLKGLKGTSTQYDKDGRIIKTADRSKNVRIIEGLQDTDTFKHLVSEAGGNPNIGAFPSKTPDGKSIYATTDEVLIPMVEEYFQNITPEEFRALGLQSTSVGEAKAEMLEIIRNQNKAYGDVVSSAADILDAGVDTVNRKDWSAESNARAWEGLRLSREKFNHTKSRQNDSDAKKEDAFRKRNELISDLRSMKTDALSKINGLLSIDGGSAVYVDNKNKTSPTLRVKLKKADQNQLSSLGISFSKGDKETVVDINLSDPNKVDALNKLLDKIGSTSAEKKLTEDAEVLDFGVEAEDEVIDFGNN